MQTLLPPLIFVTQLLVLAYPWCAVFAQVPLELSTPVYADEDHDLPPAACGLPVQVSQHSTVGTPPLLCHYKTTTLSAPASSSSLNCHFSVRASVSIRAARMQTLLPPLIFVTQLLVLAYPWCAVFAQVPLELSTPVYADEDHDLPPAACGLPVQVSQHSTVGTPPLLCHYKTTTLSAPASSSSINRLFSRARISAHRRAARMQTLLHPFFFVTLLLVLAYPWCAVFAQVPLELAAPVYADEDHDLPPAACGLPVQVSQHSTVGTPPLLCHYKTTTLSAPASSSSINRLFSRARVREHRSLRVASSGFATCHRWNTTGALSPQDNSIVSASIVIIYKLPVLKCARQCHRRAARMKTLLHPFFFFTQLLDLAYSWCAVFAQVPLEHSTPVYADEDHDLPTAACGLPFLVSQPATVGTPQVLCHYKTKALSAAASSSTINCLFSSAPFSEHRRAAWLQTLLHPFFFVTQLLVLAYPWCAVFAQVPLELSTPLYADEDHDLPAAARGLPVLVSQPATVGTPPVLCHSNTTALSAPASSSSINRLFSRARVSAHRRAARMQTLLHPFFFVTLLLVLAYPWCAVFAQVPLELSTPVYADEDHDLPPAACGLPVQVSQHSTVGTPPLLCHYKTTTLSAPASSSSINRLFSRARVREHRWRVACSGFASCHRWNTTGAVSLQDKSIVSASIVIIYKLPVLKCARQCHRRAPRMQTLIYPFLFVTQLLDLAYPWCAVLAQVPLELSTPVYADKDHDLPPAACGLPLLVSRPATVGTPPVLCHHKITALSAPASSSSINCLFSSARVSVHRRAARMKTLLHPFFFFTQLLDLAYSWCAVFAQVPLELSTPVYADEDHDLPPAAFAGPRLSLVRLAQVPLELWTPVYADEDHDLPPAACGLPLLVSRPATVGAPLVLCDYKTTALSAPASSSPINCLFSSARFSGHRRAARIQTLLYPLLFVAQSLVFAYLWCAVFAQVFLELSAPEYADEDHDLSREVAGVLFWVRYLPSWEHHRCSVTTRQEHCQRQHRHHLYTASSQVRASLLVLAYPWCAVLAQVPLQLWTPVYADEDHDLPPAACGLPLLVLRPATLGTPPVICHYKTTALSASASPSSLNCMFSSARVREHRRAARMQTLLHSFFFVAQLLVLAYPWSAVFAQEPLELSAPEYVNEDHDLSRAACGLPVLVSQPATVGTPQVLCHYKTTALSAPASSSTINCLLSSARVSEHQRAARMKTLLHPFFFVTQLLVLAYPWCVVFAQVFLELSAPEYADEDHDLSREVTGCLFWLRYLPLFEHHWCSVTTKQQRCQRQHRHHL
ncbi:hypothetical protein V5799_023703 [Amblyomma americanum]|uniref:Uncharacterized protein n=1 Tax=Amblyomma americanum TaxID=6943 RepID=A0AAQ4FHA9_AMBAM